MTPAITLWAAFVLATGVIAWFGSKRQAIAFLVVAIATAALPITTLGHPTPRQPPTGEHTVLGARIDKDVAIYVLLDGVSVGSAEPRYYVLPYSDQAANDLQRAMDGGQGVAMEMGEDGSPGFGEPSVEPEAPKQKERAVLG